MLLGKKTRGRIVSILVRRSDVGVNLGNIYAPTNLTEQKNFFNSFYKFFIPSSAIIITGDFNCYNNALDKFSENVSIPREYKSLKSDMSMLMFGIIDIPVQGSLRGLIQPCLLGVDWANFFISEDLLSLGVQCDIDHFWSSVRNGFS